MRNLLIAVLLAIFSVQGVVAAMGGDPVVQVQGQEQNENACMTASCPSAMADDGDAATVSLSIEELSDYVVPDLPASEARHCVAFPTLLRVCLLSTDLPRIKPPPRA